MPELVALLPAIIAAVVGAAPGIWALIQKRKIDDATYSDMVTETAKKWIKQYEERVAKLEETLLSQQREIESLQEQVNVQGKEIRLLRDGAMRLQGQVISLGQKPVFEIEEKDE